MQTLAPRKHRRSRSRGEPRLRFAGFVVTIALLAVQVASVFAAEDAIPRAPDRWVTDTAGLLSEQAQKGLDARLEAYERQTGHQIVVWIGTTLGPMPLEDFAVKAFQAWQIGRRHADDGVLVAVFATDRRIAIETGYGLEGEVPDAVASRIIRDVMAPRLRAGQPDAAIVSGVDAILLAIDGKPFAGDAPGPTGPGRLTTGELILGFLLGAGFLLLLITHPRMALALLFVMSNRGGGGGGLGGGFGGGGGRSGGGGARGSW